MINILLADDHGVVREGFANMLSEAADLHLLASVASGEEAVKQTRELKPDVVLMDVYMPGMGGLEAMRAILKRCQQVRVIGLSAYTGDGYPVMFVRAGASGFIGKDCTVDELHNAIRSVHAGQQHLPENLEPLAEQAVAPDSNNPFTELSDRELQTALLVIDGYDNDAIAEVLKIGDRTVNKYKFRLFEKLQISSEVELVALAIRHGIVDPQQVKVGRERPRNADDDSPR